MVVDPGNFIREISEDDNEASASLSVGGAPAPNLFIHSNNIAIFPDEPISGEEVTLRAIVGNNGTAPAQQVSVQFVDITGGEARLLGSEQTIPAIGVGSSGAAAVTITDESGAGERPIRNRKLQVLVDASNRIRESSEEDNTATRQLIFRPAPAPNLIVLAAQYRLQSGQPARGRQRDDSGGRFATMETFAAKDVAVQFEDVSAGRPVPIGATQNLDRIPVGGSGVVTLKFTPPKEAGTYKVRVVADPGNLHPRDQ